ncbi:MAG: sulfopyruvate decarboxylase subunit alpha [Thermoplasmata archaeon]|nr:sulfopyruvate decarboxylase subunit alpha [Thermoplasmata archaeon]
MHEESVIEQLEAAGVDMVVSLPCDKNKRFTDLVHERMRVVDVTREEDGVGICAGAYLVGGKPVMSIQSSGLGNMLNAMMSLTDCYRLPLVVLASWRGVDGEKIEAQVPFNSRIPQLLDVYGILCYDVSTKDDIPEVGRAIDDAYSQGRMAVVLIHPKLWEDAKRLDVPYPPRVRSVRVDYARDSGEPTLTRLEAIGEVMRSIGDDEIVVSNIGVPSKETFASRDRPLNFYMLGSYTQATPIGLGMALASDRRVTVIDGDGSLLGSSVFPVLSSERPDNLTVVCMDNGTFGSTGNQMNQSYLDVDMGSVASAYGLGDVRCADTPEGIRGAMAGREAMRFVQVPIRPGNSASPNIVMTAAEIRDRFMGALHG